jgi:hypothetical protein
VSQSFRYIAPALLALSLTWTSCSLVNQDLPNESPVVQVRDADTTVVSRGGRVSLRVTASDEDDDPLRYEWTALGAGTLTDSLKNATDWVAPSLITGNSEFFLILVTIIDSQPDTEDPVESFLIEVVQRVPVLVAPTDTAGSFRDPEIVVEIRATDEDNDALSFDWVLLEGGLTSDQVSIRQQTQDGLFTLRVLALEPGDVLLSVETTDGSDTLRAELTVTVEAPQLPENGTVTLELPDVEGGTRSYDIDVYEYPNQKGVEPLLVESWFEADALCQARDMRLCSTEEWTNACRGPEGFNFSSVDDPNTLPENFGLRYCHENGSALWGGDDQNLEDVSPSGSFSNCTSGTGVFDLTGNAHEWVQVWIPPEADATSTEGVGRSGTFSFSASYIPGQTCGSFSSPLGLIQLEGELPQPVSQAFIDSVLSAPIDPAFVEESRTSAVYLPYFTAEGSHRGFRCCR